MKILFYSNRCKFSKKALIYLEKHNIKDMFKLVNIDNEEYPEYIDVVPTIIDTELTELLKYQPVFEYLTNIRYFNNPTNNVEYIKDIINPNIPDDELADKNEIPFIYLDNNNNNNNNNIEEKTEITEITDINKIAKNMINARSTQNRKLALLLRLQQK